MKLIVNYLQVLTIVGNFQISWSDSIRAMFGLSSILSSGGDTETAGFTLGGGLKCLLYSPSAPLPMNELIVNLLLFGLNTIIIVIFWFLLFAIRREGKSGDRSQAITVSLLVLCYNSYPKFIRGFFQLFSCTRFPGESVSRLVGALDVTCYSDEHRSWILSLGAPVGVVIIIGFPFLGLWKLVKESRRGRLGEAHVLGTVGFLYDGYQPHLYFWDIFTFIRNIALSAIIVFLNYSDEAPYQQGLAALFVFIVCGTLHVMLSPYQDTALNYLEGLGLMVSMMTLYLGVWTFSASGASQIFISILIFILNGIWLLCVTGILFASFGNKVKKVFDWIGNKICKRGKVDGHVMALPSSSEVALEMGSLTSVQGSSTTKIKREKEKVKGDTLIVNPLMMRK